MNKDFKELCRGISLAALSTMASALLILLLIQLIAGCGPCIKEAEPVHLVGNVYNAYFRVKSSTTFVEVCAQPQSEDMEIEVGMYAHQAPGVIRGLAFRRGIGTQCSGPPREPRDGTLYSHWKHEVSMEGDAPPKRLWIRMPLTECGNFEWLPHDATTQRVVVQEAPDVCEVTLLR